MTKNRKRTTTGTPVTYKTPAPAGGVQLETFIPWTLVKRRVRRQIITPLDARAQFTEEAAQERRDRVAAQDTSLMRALGLAHHWLRLLDEGKCASITEIAAIEGVDLGQASRTAQLAGLAPNIVEAAVHDTENRLALEKVVRRKLPSEWSRQQRIIEE